MDGHAQPRPNPALRRLQPGKASEYIGHAPDIIRPGDTVFLICRVSDISQDHNGNLDDQETHLRQRAATLGAIVIDVERYVGAGWDPYWLARAVEKARHAGCKILFAETTDRFIRHPAFHSAEYANAQARTIELDDLKLWTKGMTLVTDLRPDATPREVRSFQSTRGQTRKGHKGGRPKKQTRRPYQKRATIDEIERIATLLDRYSVRAIARLIERPVSTTQGLIEKARRVKNAD